MITHIREEEKKNIEELLVKYNEVVAEFTSLSNVYSKVETSDFIDTQLHKLIKKGRLNMVEGKELAMATYRDEKNTLTLKISVEPNEKGVLSIHTHIQSFIEGYGFDEVNVYDSIEIASILSIVMRTVYKLSEVTLRSTLRYEQDASILQEAEKLESQLKWNDVYSNEEVKERLDKIQEVLDLSVITGKNRKESSKDTYVETINFDKSIIESFHKYRSTKEIIKMTSVYKGHQLLDTLTIEKDPTTGKYMYVLNVTKVEEYKNIIDVANVEERREVSEKNYYRLLNDMLDVIKHLAIERSGISETTIED